MAEDSYGISFMKTYLGYAVEFEKYVYIWSNALNKADNQYKKIRNERNNLDNLAGTTQRKLSGLDRANEQRGAEKGKSAAYWENLSRLVLKAGIVIFALLLLCSFLLAISLWNVPFHLLGPTIRENSFLLLLVLCTCGLFSTGIPAFLVYYFINKTISDNLKAEAQRYANSDTSRRQRILLEAQLAKIVNNRDTLLPEEEAAKQHRNNIQAELTVAQNNLLTIYSANILPAKYRNMTAVSTMYEYLDTGRCTTITGHGGIYDTFEDEMIHLQQLHQMIRMNERLDNIEDNQRYMCRQLQQANQTLTSINANTRDIAETNRRIAVASEQQTVAINQYIAWQRSR